MEPLGSSVRVNLWLILTTVVLIMSLRWISFVFPTGDANGNLSHDFNRTTVRLLSCSHVHLHCTIYETCCFIFSVDYVDLLSTFKHYDGTFSIVGLRMCFAFSRFLILIMHFERTNLLLPLRVWGSCQANEEVRLQFRKIGTYPITLQ
jgi:hypothetical protein